MSPSILPACVTPAVAAGKAVTFETDADRLAVIQCCDGQLVTVATASVWGIFENAYAEDLNIAGTRPQLRCRTTDVSTAIVGTAVVVNELSYLVRGVQPDGTGMTVLILELQS